VAINLEPVKLGNAEQHIESLPNTRLQRLVDEGAVYAPQAMNPSQFATLHALLERILLHDVNPAQLAARLDTALANGAADSLCFTAPHLLAFDYQLGLDELDTIAHTTTGFSFAELTPEIQDAMLGLVAARNLTTRKLDLALWLDDLRHNTAAGLALSVE
jgi:Gluconate 2-dehydrogenase subunit 3